MSKTYYFDNAATTPLAKPVLDAMLPYLTTDYANASTIYTPGQFARNAVEKSRRTIAACIGAKASEIYFTSGGSESDNWALKASIRLAEQKESAESNHYASMHIITDVIEHHAILETCADLEEQGTSVTRLPVDAEGHVDPDAVIDAIRDDTTLVSIMLANNEIGTIEPIREIGLRIKAYNQEHGTHILFHTDAVQAFGHIPIHVDDLCVDLLSTSAHKLNGPKGVGFLYVRSGVNLPSFIHGGGQERGKRAGTENVAGIVGFAKAAELHCAVDSLTKNMKKEIAVRNHMIQRLLAEIPDTTLNGDPDDWFSSSQDFVKASASSSVLAPVAPRRLPNNINLSFDGIDSETLLMLLDEHGIYASAGSACSSGSVEPSHVLLAIGKTRAEAKSSLRFTISHDTTQQDADVVVEALKSIITTLKV